jgi:phage gp36-like protein
MMSDINGRLPSAFLIQALDDDEDGSADAAAWAAVVADVQSKIDGILGTRYSVPFTNPIPAVVLDAAKTFACDFIYARRGMTTEESNPWMDRAEKTFETLKEIAAGKLPLTPDKGRSKPSASVITSSAKTVPTGGQNLA